MTNILNINIMITIMISNKMIIISDPVKPAIMMLGRTFIIRLQFTFLDLLTHSNTDMHVLVAQEDGLRHLQKHSAREPLSRFMHSFKAHTASTA